MNTEVSVDGSVSAELVQDAETDRRDGRHCKTYNYQTWTKCVKYQIHLSLKTMNNLCDNEREQGGAHILASSISAESRNKLSPSKADFNPPSLCARVKPKAHFPVWINMTQCIMKKKKKRRIGLKVKNQENRGSSFLEAWQSKFGERPSLKPWEGVQSIKELWRQTQKDQYESSAWNTSGSTNSVH